MSNLIPEPISHQELAELLRWAADEVEQHDSWEGNIAWEISEDTEADALVHGVIRVGNLNGQGGVRIIGSVPK